MLLPEDLRNYMQSKAGSGKLFVAGGYIRSTVSGEPVSDIDVLGSEGSSGDASVALAASRRVDRHVTNNAVTVLAPNYLPVQFITRWTYPDGVAGAVSIVESFDFTVCQAVIWHKPESAAVKAHWASLCSDDFYPDLASKRLRYTAPKRDEDSGGSMLRVCKYLRRGYFISPEGLAAVIARLVVGGIIPHDKGEDVAARSLRARLREVDPIRVVDGLRIIDEHGQF